MSSERQTNLEDRYGLIRARLDCGKCGRLLARLATDPDDPSHTLPRLWSGNPSRRADALAKRSRGGYARYVPAATPGQRGEYRHRYRCECGADWPFGSYRLGRAILAKAKASGRGTVRLVAGVDV